MYVFDLKTIILFIVVVCASIVVFSVLATSLYYRRSRKLAQTSKMVTEFSRVNSFLGAFAHEIRTPLTTILVHLEIARLDQINPEIRSSSLELIRKEINRVNRIIQDISLFNRYQLTTNNDHAAIDFLLVIEAAIAQVILQAEAKNITIEFDHDEGIHRIMGSADRLEQLFINILDNAVKYCRTGDIIFVKVRQHEKFVQCIIQDTGPGIAKEHLIHVTEPLYRIRKDIEGSGLGLAIAAEIAKNHQAELAISSDQNSEENGTTVYFAIPIVK